MSAEELDALEAERKAIALELQGAEQKAAEEEAAEGQPRPILPYSSLFVLGPSNMYALQVAPRLASSFIQIYTYTLYTGTVNI